MTFKGKKMKKKGEGKFGKEKQEKKFFGTDKKGDKWSSRGSVHRPESVKNRGSKRG